MENVRQVYEMTYESDDDEDSGGHLIEAARNLLTAFQDLLNASRPMSAGVRYRDPSLVMPLIRYLSLQSDLSISEELASNEGHKLCGKTLLESVNRVGETSRVLLQIISHEQNQISDAEWEIRDTLLTDAKVLYHHRSERMWLTESCFSK